MKAINFGELNELLWECRCTDKAGKNIGDEIEALLPGFIKALKAESTQLSVSENVQIEELVHLMHGFAMHRFHDGVRDKSDNDVANMILYCSLFGFLLGLYLGQEGQGSVEARMIH